MKVKDAMNPKVVVATKDVSIKEAARIMAKFKIGSLVIVEKEKMTGVIKYDLIVEGENVIGIITESDIVRKVVATGLDTAQTKIEETMTKDVITVGSEIDLGEACQTMVEHKIKRMLLLNMNS